jgi:hypothetical protein
MKKSKRTHKAATRSTPHDGELRRDAEEVVAAEGRWRVVGPGKPPKRAPRNYRYVDELVRLQFELLKMQEWVRLQGLRVCVLFEGRDAAGKGGVIKRITESLNPLDGRRRLAGDVVHHAGDARHLVGDAPRAFALSRLQESSSPVPSGTLRAWQCPLRAVQSR